MANLQKQTIRDLYLKFHSIVPKDIVKITIRPPSYVHFSIRGVISTYKKFNDILILNILSENLYRIVQHRTDHLTNLTRDRTVNFGWVKTFFLKNDDWIKDIWRNTPLQKATFKAKESYSNYDLKVLMKDPRWLKAKHVDEIDNMFPSINQALLTALKLQKEDHLLQQQDDLVNKLMEDPRWSNVNNPEDIDILYSEIEKDTRVLLGDYLALQIERSEDEAKRLKTEEQKVDAYIAAEDAKKNRDESFSDFFKKDYTDLKICNQCGGDGGINGGCKKCGGTGWIDSDS